MFKENLIKVGIASRILDQDATLSITNLLMFVLITKIAFAPTLDLPTVASLFLACAQYTGKKVLKLKTDDKAAKEDSKLEDHVAKLAEVVGTVTALQNQSTQASIMNQILGR